MKVRVTFEADIIPGSERDMEKLIGARFYIIPDTFHVGSLPKIDTLDEDRRIEVSPWEGVSPFVHVWRGLDWDNIPALLPPVMNWSATSPMPPAQARPFFLAGLTACDMAERMTEDADGNGQPNKRNENCTNEISD